MKMKPRYYLLIIIFCFILGNSLATIPVIALNSGNLSTDELEGIMPVENKIDFRESDETTAVQGELVGYDGRSTAIETDIAPPEDPPEITGRNYSMTTTTFSWDDATDGNRYTVRHGSVFRLSLSIMVNYVGTLASLLTVRYP